MKRFKAAILGGSGFLGAELVRRLLQHPDIELVRVCAADHVGQPLASALPHLEGATSLVFENPPPDEAVRDVEVVLMGLPHQVSVTMVEAAFSRGTRVIDLSGAFRLKEPEEYARYYGTPHPRPDLLARFVYGLPELNRSTLRDALAVSSPGCFATTITLGLLPFARQGLLAGGVDCVGVTGSSGSGAAPSPATHHPTRAQNLRTYRPLAHQHTPEVEHTLTQAGAKNLRLSFVPVSAPLTRGIFVSSFFRVPDDLDAEALTSLLREAYASEPFVRVPASRLPEVVAVSGSNFAEVGIAVGEAREGERTVTALSALDNLIRGGAGQAIQNLNLMLGLPETRTLEDLGPYP
jgi:N-acetyl-gamma-glutamyl-phosphate reductase